MLTATVIGFDGTAARYTSEEHAEQRMDEIFERLADGRAYQVEADPDGGAVGGVFGPDIYRHWTLGDEAGERDAGKRDVSVTYRLVAE
jgi:hypothetical protein